MFVSQFLAWMCDSSWNILSAFVLRIIDEITQNVMGENIDFETVKKNLYWIDAVCISDEYLLTPTKIPSAISFM